MTYPLKKIYFVDPMGYGNLSQYDESLLSNILKLDIVYFTNIKFDAKPVPFPTYRIYRYSDKKGLGKILSYLRSQLFLLAKVISDKPGIIHFQWLKIPWLDFLLIRFFRLKGIKIVFTAHNILPHNSGDRYRKAFGKLYAAMDKIIVHTGPTKKELSEKFCISKEKITIIPHGLLEIQNVDRKKVNVLKDQFAEDLGLDKKLIFSFLGSISKYKGVDVVIDAWSEIQDDDIHLLIGGKGKVKNLEKILAKPNVTLFNRFLSNEEFQALLELSDFVLLPYREISQSGVLLSALSKRKKVIVSNKGGLVEPFEFGQIGYILSELNEEVLIETIQIAKSQEVFSVNEEVWVKIEAYYDWKEIGNKTALLYQSLLKE